MTTTVFDTCGGRMVRRPGIYAMRRALPVVAVALAVAGCAAPRGEEVSQTGFLNRPDGVAVGAERVELVDRWRPFGMDHGSGVQAGSVERHAWMLRIDGDAAQVTSIGVPGVWRRPWWDRLGTADRPFTELVMRAGGVSLDGCPRSIVAVRTGAAYGCPGTDRLPHVRQLGRRGEDIWLQGTSLYSGQGLGAETKPCSVDLRWVSDRVSVPFPTRNIVYQVDFQNNFGDSARAGFRFSLSHLPSVGAFIVDNVDPRMAIYRVTCGNAERVAFARPGETRSTTADKPQGDEDVFQVVDIVPDGDGVALLLNVPRSRGGYDVVVRRADGSEIAMPLLSPYMQDEYVGFYLGRPTQLLGNVRYMTRNGQTQVRLWTYDTERREERILAFPVPGEAGWASVNG